MFVLWLLPVPEPMEKSAEMAAALSGASPLIFAGWLVFRCLGSGVVVPLAEELAFRGYLLNRFAGEAPSVSGGIRFTWISFLLPSVLFRVFHGACGLVNQLSNSI